MLLYYEQSFCICFCRTPTFISEEVPGEDSEDSEDDDDEDEGEDGQYVASSIKKKEKNDESIVV